MVGRSTPDVSETLLPDSKTGDSATVRVPGLTILCHPDMARVGERALLLDLHEGGTLALNRHAPLFAPVDGDPSRALESPYVSARHSIELVDRGLAGIEIRPYARALVALGRSPLQEPRLLSLAEVRGGVILTLARRIALLLHHVELSGVALSPAPTPRPRPPRLDMIGASDALDRVRSKIANVAELGVHVLIRGESGAGKELVARGLWRASARSEGPFEPYNMSSVPEGNLGLSMLFGHVKGAFTGANARFRGLLERNDGGTVFLDEIAACELQVQDRLLRVLEDGVVTPLGAERGHPVDVRILSATDADLGALTASGGFRPPLYHRLAQYIIHVPPLNARRDDVARLVVHFLRRRLAEDGSLHLLEPPGRQNKPWFPAELMALLVAHDWTGGNVRALSNVIDRIWIEHRHRERIDLAEAEALIAGGRVHEPPPRRVAAAVVDEAATVAPAAAGPPSRAEFVEVYRANQFSPARTARALGRPKATIHSWLERFGLRLAKQIDEDELRAVYQELDGDLAATARRLMVSLRSLQMRLRALGIAVDADPGAPGAG